MSPRARRKQAPQVPWYRRDGVAALALVLAVVLVYLPTAWCGYVWDDDDHLTANPTIVGPLGFREIWTTAHADVSPLTRSTFWLEHALWGLVPWPYHLVNVALHAACAVVLWRVLRRLCVPGAWLGAALWALHPVQVESVAWISEMKNTESGLFFLLSIFFYLKTLADAPEPRGRWSYPLALLFGLAAIACKSSTVVLPVVLLMTARWSEGRWNARHLLRVAPLVLAALAAGAVTIWTQHLVLAKAIDPMFIRSGPQRIAAAGDAVWFYLGKLLWPNPLMAVYPRWSIDVGSMAAWLPLCALLIAGGVLALLASLRLGWSSSACFVLAYFVVALAPALGLIDGTIFHHSLVFDHFQYLASMGPLALVGAGFAKFLATKWQPMATTVLLATWGAVSFARTWAYQSDETLWADTLAKNPDTWVGHYDFANDLAHAGQLGDAMTQYRAALVLYPRFAQAHLNLGNALLREGQGAGAIGEYRQAAEDAPDNAEAHFDLGNSLAQAGQIDEGLPELRRAVELDPQLIAARLGLATALQQKGALDEAAGVLEQAVTLAPQSIDVHLGLGNTYFMQRRFDRAAGEFEAALRLNPGDARVHNNLGLALGQEGRREEAIAQFEEALRLQPGYADAQANLEAARR
jgi:tetratricopeptide (TPR) repeat protein